MSDEASARTGPDDPRLEGAVVHVLGHGRFGRHAAQALIRLPVRCVVVVDRDRSGLGQDPLRTTGDTGPKRPVLRIQADAVSHVVSLLDRPGQPRHWLVPTLPVHLAAEVACRASGWRKSTRDRSPPWPDQVVGPTHDIYSSLAAFRCPDDCPGPTPAPPTSTWAGSERDPDTGLVNLRNETCSSTWDGAGPDSDAGLACPKVGPFSSTRAGARRNPDEKLVCPQTGEVRDLPDRLEHADWHGAPSRVIVSRQLAPGVGGYPLQALAEVVAHLRTTGRRELILHTASACHGVSSRLEGR